MVFDAEKSNSQFIFEVPWLGISKKFARSMSNASSTTSDAI